MPRTEIGTSERLLEELKGWVLHETPTTDAAAVNGLIGKAEAELRAVGAAIERIPGRDGYGDTLIARTPGEGPPVVVAGHLDTVWDHGTLASSMPWRVEGEKAHGPGIYDMKAGSFSAFHSVREILRQKVKTKRPIILLLTPDEEVGSPTSRAPIERAATGARAVLIPEPAGAGGACVTARKGVGRFVMKVHGVSAHAGGNWQDGRSAVVPLARKILEIHALTDLASGTTTNVAPIWGGTRPNVVPPEAGCEIDCRVTSVPEGERIERLIHAMAGEADGIRIEVEGGMNRPPMVETPEIAALHEMARGIAAKHGYDLPKMHRGGGSDGNFTAAMGIPTLDGLGCTGAGAHAPHEHILWRDLAPRCATLCELLETIE
ncbi:M20 family metallopeptidase [Roseomonas alkaliterrae]|uniref:Glutamate carboxypeptidase n=1 Tax=Neoroseomonas alkaliterrae TaxID=1452450 RepID=A0A840XUZ9_9PROT|nr:M20 family metallopeptidase [Neoroseomonas alkaliterrae]MBB5687977.1 glutamate carboxypeptidase [Neoroseomonas alkaliterrae]MBR0678138.1 M20 family metallopeptidase [Neoroseomonas alkaliterrae]